MIAVSIGYFIINTVHVFLFVRQIKETHNWISSCENKGYHSGNPIDRSERILIGIARKVNKLQSASNTDRNVLIENNWVENEERSSVESDFHVPEEFVRGWPSALLNFEDYVNHWSKDKIKSCSKANIVNVSEKGDVMMIVLVLGRGIVV